MGTESKPSRAHAPPLQVGVVMAVAAGVVMRFVAPSPMWLDEALSVNIASLPLGDIGEALRRDGHPPLYYVLLHGWMQLFGDSNFAVRALSGVLSLLMLPLAWVAGRRLGDSTVAAWAVVVLALSPFAIRYGTEARMYALVMLLVLAGYLLVTDALRAPTALRLVGVAAIVGALLWTHYWALYLLAVTGAGALLVAWRAPAMRRGALAVAGAHIVGGLLFLPWLPSMLVQLQETGTPWARASRPQVVAAVTLDDLGGGGFAESRLLGALSLLLLVVALFGRRRDDGRAVELRSSPTHTVRWEVLVVAATMALGALVSFTAASAYASRYAAVVVPLLLLAVAVGFAVLPRGSFRTTLAVAYVGLALIGIGIVAAEPRTQARDHARELAARAGPEDLVVACPDQLAPSTHRALRLEGVALDVVPYPSGGDPRFVDWRDYEARNAAADPVAFAEEVHELAGDGHLWVVWHGTYRTFEDQCEALVVRLGELRTPEVIVDLGTSGEVSRLFRYE